jgi:hypothetical protein
MKKPAGARPVIRTGTVIGGADGDFDGDERAVVREARHALDLPPHAFGLRVTPAPRRAARRGVTEGWPRTG